jgi:hypothetical protein
MFSGHFISCFGDTVGPSRAPDLTTPDFFLWGYLRCKVYWHHGVERAHFTDEIKATDAPLLQRVMENS